MSSAEILQEKVNPMRNIRVYSVTLNMSVGSSETKLEGAVKILEKLTGQKPSLRKAKKTIKEFNIKKGEPIACMVTVRGRKAEDLLERLLRAVNKKLNSSSFTEHGNFNFGIKEYIDIEGLPYDPSIGILGMDVCVNLARAGLRVEKRRIKKSKIGKHHRVSKEEAIEFMKKRFNVEIL